MRVRSAVESMSDSEIRVERADDWETLQRLLYREADEGPGGRYRT